jgi:hypothetical protein
MRMPELLLALVPKKFRPVAKAFYAFIVPLIGQVILQVTDNGITLGNAIRIVAVSAVIAAFVHQAPNTKA